MSTKEERLSHLLACIGEECGETQQMVGKCLRFGIHSESPKTGKVNLNELMAEFRDIYTMMHMFNDELGKDGFRMQRSSMYKESKAEKVERYLKEVLANKEEL